MRSLIPVVSLSVALVLGPCLSGFLVVEAADPDPVNHIEVKLIAFRPGCEVPESEVQIFNKSTEWEYKVDVSATARTAHPGPTACGGECVNGQDDGEACWSTSECEGGTCVGDDIGTPCTVVVTASDVVLTDLNGNHPCDHRTDWLPVCSPAISDCDNEFLDCTFPYDPESDNWCVTFTPVSIEATEYRAPGGSWTALEDAPVVVCERPLVPFGPPECIVYSLCDEDNTADLCTENP